jgi:hypothetical protein
MRKSDIKAEEKQRRNEMMNTKVKRQVQTIPQPTETWVHEVLQPDQLSTAKQSFGRRKLSPATIVLMWALRIYVLLMVLLIAFQVWHALHP